MTADIADEDSAMYLLQSQVSIINDSSLDLNALKIKNYLIKFFSSKKKTIFNFKFVICVS